MLLLVNEANETDYILLKTYEISNVSRRSTPHVLLSLQSSLISLLFKKKMNMPSVWQTTELIVSLVGAIGSRR
jgi:hypothetical protein